jgi:hypothetical protein
VEKSSRPEPTLIGTIGVAQRTHYLEDYSQLGWATSQCGAWAGQVKIMYGGGKPSCFQCRALMNVKPTKFT